MRFNRRCMAAFLSGTAATVCSPVRRVAVRSGWPSFGVCASDTASRPREPRMSRASSRCSSRADRGSSLVCILRAATTAAGRVHSRFTLCSSADGPIALPAGIRSPSSASYAATGAPRTTIDPPIWPLQPQIQPVGDDGRGRRRPAGSLVREALTQRRRVIVQSSAPIHALREASGATTRAHPNAGVGRYVGF